MEDEQQGGIQSLTISIFSEINLIALKTAVIYLSHYSYACFLQG